jgi:hypothetical protein
MSVGSYARKAGVGNNQSNEPASATRRPSKCGRKSAGPLKKAEQEKAIILLVDEAGLYLLPMAERTWAPRGQTPILRVNLTRDHLIFHQWDHP